MSEIATRNSGFSLQPRNLPEAMQMADMLSKSQMVPRCYQGKPQDTLVAMMMGSELGLNPIQSLQNIAVINGKPSIYGDAMLALVQNHPTFGGIKESFDDKTMTATCTVWRKGGEQHTQTFTKADAEAAGLWGKAGPWKQYPKRMLAFRARGFALRNQFADALAGLISREEAEDMPVERDVTPDHTAPERQALTASITDDQAESLRHAIEMAGLTEEKFCGHKSIRIASLGELPAARYEGAMNYLKSLATQQEETADALVSQ